MRFNAMSLRSTAALALAAAFSTYLLAADRQLVNGWDVRDEIALAPGTDPAFVKDYLPSFYDYLDTVLFHPSAGYYSSGRVNFDTHYRTFPITLNPSFGSMIAEQIFRMWQGMRAAGTLAPNEKFTIAEFGAGNGVLAESILNHIDQQALTKPEWQGFKEQTVYASYDRSPALSAAQRERNARFGSRFEAREGDATSPGSTIAPGSLKGVVLSNELPDCFSVYKVILGSDGSAEVAFVLPSLPKSVWSAIGDSLPPSGRERIAEDDAAIYEKLLAPAGHERVYLSRFGFSAVLDALSKTKDYDARVSQLQFQEIYLPVSVFPELAEHLRRYARPYAYALAKSGTGMVTYINLGEGAFIRGAGAALTAGYAITIDYGYNWEGSLGQELDHLRMYGPGASPSRANPYHTPTLNDMTTDVNFSHIAAEGETVGLKSLYFGPQHALETGTGIKPGELPPGHTYGAEDFQDVQQWADWFYTWEVYKMLVQQKVNTDSAYKYPEKPAETLLVDDTGLTSSQQARMAEIEKRLRR